jgi:CxxC motif-containing protein
MAITKKTITCIGCPMGCQVTATIENNVVTQVEGNSCAIGDRYARTEVTHPMRTVTTTIRTKGGDLPVCSVKTASEIPKEKIKDCIAAIKDLCVPAPVHIGQVVYQNIVGTGVDIIATKDIQAV